MNDLKIFIIVFLKKIGLLFFFFLFMYLDSTSLKKSFNYGHLVLNVLAIIAGFVLYLKSKRKTKQLLIFYFVSAVFIEYFFSLFLHAYIYRVAFIPLYVLIGHCIIYERLFSFVKTPIFLKYQKAINYTNVVLILLISSYFLANYNDYFGFVMTILFFILCSVVKRTQSFFLMSFVVIAIMEIIGTYFGCWVWQKQGFLFFNFLPSANPPIGIPLFYYLISFFAYSIYFSLNPLVWKRFKKQVVTK